MEKQKANSIIDPVTRQKVLKSLGLSMLSGLSVFLTSFVMNNDAKKSLILAAIAVLAPFAPNTLAEYRKGEKS